MLRAGERPARARQPVLNLAQTLFRETVCDLSTRRQQQTSEGSAAGDVRGGFGLKRILLTYVLRLVSAMRLTTRALPQASARPSMTER
jgi:hypothetical protein